MAKTGRPPQHLKTFRHHPAAHKPAITEWFGYAAKVARELHHGVLKDRGQWKVSPQGIFALLRCWRCGAGGLVSSASLPYFLGPMFRSVCTKREY